MKKLNLEKPILIVKREDHYEVHYSGRVEFWDLKMKKKTGESTVTTYMFSFTGTNANNTDNGWEWTSWG